MRISDWSSDVCSSELALLLLVATHVAALTDQFVVETVDHPTPRFATDERDELLVARAFEESHGDVVPIAVVERLDHRDHVHMETRLPPRREFHPDRKSTRLNSSH